MHHEFRESIRVIAVNERLEIDLGPVEVTLRGHVYALKESFGRLTLCIVMKMMDAFRRVLMMCGNSPACSRLSDDQRTKQQR